MLFLVNNNYSSLQIYSETISFPVSIYLFKVNNKNTRKWCETCLKLTKPCVQNHFMCTRKPVHADIKFVKTWRGWG